MSYDVEPRWYGDERGLPPCRDPEHRHSGRCEDWALPPVPWIENVHKAVTISTKPNRAFRVVHHHRPTGCVVAVDGNDLDTLHEKAAFELRSLIASTLRTQARAMLTRSDNVPLGRDAHETGAVVRVGDLREQAQRLLDEAEQIEKEASP